VFAFSSRSLAPPHRPRNHLLVRRQRLLKVHPDVQGFRVCRRPARGIFERNRDISPTTKDVESIVIVRGAVAHLGACFQLRDLSTLMLSALVSRGSEPRKRPRPSMFFFAGR
jgi:hypothetical protein